MSVRCSVGLHLATHLLRPGVVPPGHGRSWGIIRALCARLMRFGHSVVIFGGGFFLVGLGDLGELC